MAMSGCQRTDTVMGAGKIEPQASPLSTSESGGPTGEKREKFDRTVIAFVDDSAISMEELRNALATDISERHLLLRAASAEAYWLDFTNRRAVNRMFYLEATKRGISPPGIEKMLSLDRVFLEKVEYLSALGKGVKIEENGIRERAPRNWERIRLQELIVESEEAAKSALRRVEAGESFDALVRELSIGPAAHKDGKMDYIWFYPYNGIFDATQSGIVFSLKEGEISPVLKTPLGFGIYKLLERHRLSEAERKLGYSSIEKSEAREQLQREIADIYARHRIWSINDRKKPVDYYRLFEEWYMKSGNTRELEERVVARIDDSEIRFSDVLYVDTMVPETKDQMGKLERFGRLQEMLDRIVETMVISKEAERSGHQLSLSSQTELQTRRENLTVEHFLDGLFRQRVDMSDDALKAFYRRNIGRYSPGESAAFHYLFVKERAKIEEAYRLLREGRNFEEVAMDLSEQFPLGKGPDAGYRNKSDLDNGLAEKIFALSIGEVSAPIPSSDGYLLVKVYDRKRSKANDFENVRRVVRMDFEKIGKKRFYEELVKDLKGKYRFSLNEKDKEYFLGEIEKTRKRAAQKEKLRKGIHHGGM